MTATAPIAPRRRRRASVVTAALAAASVALAAGSAAGAREVPPASPAAASVAHAAGARDLRAEPAGCGGVERAQPARRQAYRPPLAIGDSTMLLALPGLAREGFQVNAHGCRQFPEALDLLGRLAHGRLLPHLVVIALGADGSVAAGDIRRALAILGPGRLLALVTPRELGGGSGADAATVRAAGRAHPTRVRVLDWVAYAAGHGGDWFQPDGLHLTFAGADQFARFLARVLPLARPAPPPAASAPRACPTRAPDGAAGGLDPTAPAVSLAISGGVLATTTADPRAVSLVLRNANPFPLAATLTIEPVDGLPAARACVTLPGAGQVAPRLELPAPVVRRLAVIQRFPVVVRLRVYDAAGTAASVSGVYRLERPARRPPAATS